MPNMQNVFIIFLPPPLPKNVFKVMALHILEGEEKLF